MQKSGCSMPKPCNAIDFQMKTKRVQKRRCCFIIWSNDNQILHKSYKQVTLMSPSTTSHLPPLAYLHLVTPCLTLGPASGDEGEFVALPLWIQAPVAVVELLMLQTAPPSPTSRNLGHFPSTFLTTRRPPLHLPSTNRLLESPVNFFFNILGCW